MPPAKLGGKFVNNGRRPDSGKLIGNNTHSDTGSANQNTAMNLGGTDTLGNLCRHIGIIGGLRGIHCRTEFFNGMSVLP